MCADSPTPCKSITDGTHIFVGRVLSVTRASSSTAGASPLDGYVSVTLAVSEVLNGPGAAGDTITLTTPSSDGARDQHRLG